MIMTCFLQTIARVFRVKLSTHSHIFFLVSGGWSEWEVWGRCSVTCGGGVQTRLRTCTNPPPSSGGVDCQGNNLQSQTCNTNGCPGKGQLIIE